MLTKSDPYMSSIEQHVDPERVGIRKMSEMNLVMIDLTNANLDQTIDID